MSAAGEALHRFRPSVARLRICDRAYDGRGLGEGGSLPADHRVCRDVGHDGGRADDQPAAVRPDTGRKLRDRA